MDKSVAIFLYVPKEIYWEKLLFQSSKTGFSALFTKVGRRGGSDYYVLKSKCGTNALAKWAMYTRYWRKDLVDSQMKEFY